MRYAILTWMLSPVDRLNEMPPLPRHVSSPQRTGRYVLVLVTTLLIANAIVGQRGLIALLRANRDHVDQQRVIESLRAENGRLHRYIQALSEQPYVIEDLARQRLGMIKPGEQVFIVRTVHDAAANTAATEHAEAAPHATPRQKSAP